MVPAASAQPAALSAPLGRSIEQPSAYCPIPQRLITDLHDSPLAIGLYGFVARLYLVAQAPIPLSVPDIVRYDPTLSRGAVLRALARLIGGGYLIEAAQIGLKTRYTPAWGRVGGAALAWNMRQSCLGRPRHVARLRLDRRLFDICMGKLVPHTTRAAPITRYVTTPVLSLSDAGCYALTLAGLPHATPALIRIGAVHEGVARALPSDQRLLALISQRTLDLGDAAGPQAELTISGTRKLGVLPLLAPDPDASAAQPLFFVPPGMIGCLIQPLIGSMIGADVAPACSASAAASDAIGVDGHAGAITWDISDQSDSMIPPPPPKQDTHGGGGRNDPDADAKPKAAKRRQPSASLTLPQTEAATALLAINVKPAQIVELAHMPLATVTAAIADGRARPGIRDLAGWVVSLLRTHRDYGWKITPPAPAHDSPEALSDAFAQYAAAQAAEQDVVHDDSAPWFVDPSLAEPTDSALNTMKIWNIVLASMQVQVARPEFNTWLRCTMLLSIERSIATISAPSALVKERLENRYAGKLRALIENLVGLPISVRIVIRTLDVATGRVDKVHEPAAPPLDPPEQIALMDAAEQSMQPPAPDYRPDWICANQWLTLPVMLRAALIGSTVTDGAIQAISPHLTRLIATRYAREVAALGVAASSEGSPANQALAMSI